jgi:hypothetical protein
VSFSDRTGRWHPRHIDAAVAALCVLVALPFCFARVNPLLRSTGQVAKRRARLEALAADTGRVAQSLASQKERLGGLLTDLQRQKARLESAGNLNLRIAKLTSLAAATGLEVEEILPVSPTGPAGHRTVPVKLLARGSYPTCVAFLRQLKEAFPDTSVGSFELSGTPEHPKSPARFRVDLLWHVEADPQP